MWRNLEILIEKNLRDGFEAKPRLRSYTDHIFSFLLSLLFGDKQFMSNRDFVDLVDKIFKELDNSTRVETNQLQFSYTIIRQKPGLRVEKGDESENIIIILNDIVIICGLFKCIARARTGEYIIPDSVHEGAMHPLSFLDAILIDVIHKFNSKLLKHKQQKIDDKFVINMEYPNSYTNYGHWLLEFLPRLATVDELYDIQSEDVLILTRHDLPDFGLDTLEMLGFSGEQLMDCDTGAVIESKMIEQEYAGISNWKAEANSSGRRWVAKSLRGAVNMDLLSDYPSQIYIARRHQRRKICNFREIRAVLSDYGFYILNPEKLSITEQIRYFANADVIVGPSGAGLANMIFSNKAKIIELKPFGWRESSLWSDIANEFNLDHEAIISESNSNNVHQDFVINPQDLIDRLQYTIRS